MSTRDRVKPIERVPTSTLIADQLREAIIVGDFAQGDQVGEAHLAEQLGVSGWSRRACWRASRTVGCSW